MVERKKKKLKMLITKLVFWLLLLLISARDICSFLTTRPSARRRHTALHYLAAKEVDEGDEANRRNHDVLVQQEDTWMANYQKLDNYQKTGVERSPLEAQMLTFATLLDKHKALEYFFLLQK